MKILLTNDDGHRAQGINELFDSLSSKHETIMVAPDRERSSCGHAITLTKALRLTESEKNKYSCSGMPADCVLVGLGSLLKSSPPDMVISGPNHGANLGQDRFYSGTMAAAREACFRGVKAISMSLVSKQGDQVLDFSTCGSYINKLLDADIQSIIPRGAILNINVPNIPRDLVKGVKLTKPGLQKYTEDVLEREDFRGTKYYWVGGRYDGYESIEGSDCNAVYDGYISVDLQYVSSQHGTVDEEKLRKVVNCL